MFNYKWKLSDGYPKKNGLKVFSTFACGGGSSMGYKLAGYDVIGANDIDKQMEKIYRLNHNPEHYFLCDIRELKDKDLPKELFNIDILDGSPPCSTFSIAGSREKVWGKEKVFREGQSKQILDDLFYYFLDFASHIKPKVIIGENVKGLLAGNAKGYVVEIVKRLDEIGYNTQLFLLNGATMGLPQRRERVFIISYRKDLKFPKLTLDFNEKPILFKDIKGGTNDRPLKSKGAVRIWEKRVRGDKSFAYTNEREFKRPNSYFNWGYIYNNNVLATIAARDVNVLFDEPRFLNREELCLASSFPIDFDFANSRPEYIVGMSVPPIMMAQISDQINLQWFNRNV